MRGSGGLGLLFAPFFTAFSGFGVGAHAMVPRMGTGARAPSKRGGMKLPGGGMAKMLKHTRSGFIPAYASMLEKVPKGFKLTTAKTPWFKSGGYHGSGGRSTVPSFSEGPSVMIGEAPTGGFHLTPLKVKRMARATIKKHMTMGRAGKHLAQLHHARRQAAPKTRASGPVSVRQHKRHMHGKLVTIHSFSRKRFHR